MGERTKKMEKEVSYFVFSYLAWEAGWINIQYIQSVLHGSDSREGNFTQVKHDISSIKAVLEIL
jgi:hypothetical protein